MYFQNNGVSWITGFWMSLIVLSLISLTVFGYKVATNEQCPSVSIALECNLNHAGLDSNTFYVNEEITFNAHTTAPDQHISWDFGDKTPSHIGSKFYIPIIIRRSYLATVTIKANVLESVVVKVIKNSVSLFDSTVLDINQSFRQILLNWATKLFSIPARLPKNIPGVLKNFMI